MKKGTKVLVKNQSVDDFEAYVHKDNSIYETVEVTLEKAKDDEVETMTFSYSDVEIIE